MLVVSMMFCVANMNAQNNIFAPIIELLSSSTSTSTKYNLELGIKSTIQISSYNVSINGSSYRGINAVKNDGYDVIVTQTYDLNYYSISDKLLWNK